MLNGASNPGWKATDGSPALFDLHAAAEEETGSSGIFPVIGAVVELFLPRPAVARMLVLRDATFRGVYEGGEGGESLVLHIEGSADGVSYRTLGELTVGDALLDLQDAEANGLHEATALDTSGPAVTRGQRSRPGAISRESISRTRC